MKLKNFIIHDRYSATGTPRPDPVTVCKGKCEGMGFHPLRCDCRGSIKGHRPDKDMENWCFKSCDDCGGTGKGTAH